MAAKLQENAICRGRSHLLYAYPNFIASKHKTLGLVFYSLFTHLYLAGVKIASVFNAKAQAWLTGRKNIFERLADAVGGDNKIIWMHCASLGEFEQGRPILEQLKNQYRNYKILVTFFSPSGYEVQHDYNGANWVFYLPMDGKQNAARFFDLVKPHLILWVKYEYWYYYLAEAKQRNIPLFLVSGIFREDQPFFKWYGGLHRKMLSFFLHLFVQNQASADLLRPLGYGHQISVSGDTRFDRVLQIANNFGPIAAIEQFCKDHKVVVAGSTWSEDDKELDHYANTNPHIRFIIAPHNIGADRITECRLLYKSAITFTEWVEQPKSINVNTLIIDNIGMLSRLYRYATICYVGGGFGADGVHNVLEAAVYGKPVIFGPEYDKYVEAEELVECGGGISIENTIKLEEVVNDLLQDNTKREDAGKSAADYVKSKAGATENILQFIQENRLLTN